MTVKKDRPSSGMHRTYTIMEFMALLSAHIPSPYESLVYYYGYVASIIMLRVLAFLFPEDILKILLIILIPFRLFDSSI